MSKKNVKPYIVPGHGTRIKHAVVENPSLVKGTMPTDAPGSSPVAPVKRTTTSYSTKSGPHGGMGNC